VGPVVTESVGAGVTVRVKFCVAFGVTPLFAVIMIGKDPELVGDPDSVPLDERVTPVGKVPVSLNVGVG
jgi:hypothetical protein